MAEISMREKVARALSESGAAANWDHALESAVLVLAAMREPTPAMVEAGNELAGTINPTDSYQAMIDAA